MNISTSLIASPARVAVSAKPAVAKESFEAPASGDSFTLSSFDFQDAKTALQFGGLGVIPGVGAVSNFVAGMVTGIARQENASTVAFGGMLANVAGTGALITGLLIGSSTTSTIGAGLLVASGVAGGSAAVMNR